MLNTTTQIYKFESKNLLSSLIKYSLISQIYNRKQLKKFKIIRRPINKNYVLGIIVSEDIFHIYADIGLNKLAICKRSDFDDFPTNGNMLYAGQIFPFELQILNYRPLNTELYYLQFIKRKLKIEKRYIYID
jgi:hypothetical protein